MADPECGNNYDHVRMIEPKNTAANKSFSFVTFVLLLHKFHKEKHHQEPVYSEENSARARAHSYSLRRIQNSFELRVGLLGLR